MQKKTNYSSKEKIWHTTIHTIGDAWVPSPVYFMVQTPKTGTHREMTGFWLKNRNIENNNGANWFPEFWVGQ